MRYAILVTLVFLLGIPSHVAGQTIKSKKECGPALGFIFCPAGKKVRQGKKTAVVGRGLGVAKGALSKSISKSSPGLSKDSTEIIAPAPFSNPAAERARATGLSEHEYQQILLKLNNCVVEQAGEEIISCEPFGEMPEMQMAAFCASELLCVKVLVIQTWCERKRKKWDGGTDYRTCK